MARAKVMVAMSLDWLVASCPTVTEATIASVQQNEFQLKTEAGVLEYRSFVPPGAVGERLLVFARGDMVVASFNLAHPATTGETAAYTRDFRVLKTGREITDYVHKLKRRGTGSKKVEVPPGTEAHKALSSGSTCYLIVPR